MSKFINLLCGLVLFITGLQAQVTYSYIATTGDVSLSSSTTAATIQQPLVSPLAVGFPPVPGVGASVTCSFACTFSIIVGATPATTTAGTVRPVNPAPDTPAPNVQFFTASNYSGGTTLATYTLNTGQTFPVDMSAMHPGPQPQGNITIAIASGTGTVNIKFFPTEVH